MGDVSLGNLLCSLPARRVLPKKNVVPVWGYGADQNVNWFRGKEGGSGRTFRCTADRLMTIEAEEYRMIQIPTRRSFTEIYE